MFNQRFQRAVKTSIYIPRVDIQCGGWSMFSYANMGIKTWGQAGNGEALTAKLGIPSKMHLQKCVYVHS